MDDAVLFKSSFNRENLFYEVKPKGDTKKKLIKFIKARKGQSGIIYCLSRKKVEEIAELLRVNDVRALPYHAGLEPSTRMGNQDAFLNENADVIVATIAFGMGIDKPDVRFVVHYDTPKSLEGYYQETGRAGRDGQDGHCLMFYSINDIIKLEKFNKDKTVTERDNGKQLLGEMSSYAESSVCRRKQLLFYFGEYLEKDCGFCDNCKNKKATFDAQEHIILALQAVEQTQGRFNISHLCTILCGIENDYSLSYNHTELPVFGKGSYESLSFWNSVFRQSLLIELLTKDIDNYSIVSISEKGYSYLKKPTAFTFSKDHNFDEEEEAEEVQTSSAKLAFDEELFNILKGLRKKVAKEKGIPPYVVFQDPSLQEMATVYPVDMDELSNVIGVGKGKAVKFGKAFIDQIIKYVDENDIVVNKDVVVKSSVDKSKIKIYIIQQVDRKVELEEIAHVKKITMTELIQEMEHICFSGTRLNLDYYIEECIDEDKQDEIYDYFMQAENDNVHTALNILGGDYSEEEVRLMRLKFFSEIAI